jgi:FkbM family methyltransferase
MFKKIKSILRRIYTFFFPSKKIDDSQDIEKRTQFYKTLIKPGELVFDIGANVGNRIRPFLEIGAKVVAVEPQVKCIDILKNQFGTNIYYENIGLADKDGVLDFHVSNAHTLSTFSNTFIKRTKDSGRFSNFNWSTTIQVEVKTLDYLIQKYGRPKFIKIDTEGYELNVVKGLSSKIQYISFEYTLPELKENLIEIIKYFLTFGNIMINFSIGESMQFALTEWIDGYDFLSKFNNNDFYTSMETFGDVYVNMK